jgi:hypothetical protein
VRIGNIEAMTGARIAQLLATGAVPTGEEDSNGYRETE